MGVLMLTTAAYVPAQTPSDNSSVDKVMGAVDSLASLVDNFDRAVSDPTQNQSALRNGSAKAAIARATAGAATGAAIGAMTRKGEKAVVAGAIIGAVAALVYDRIKVSQEHRTESAANYDAEPLPACAVPTQDPAYAR